MMRKAQLEAEIQKRIQLDANYYHIKDPNLLLKRYQIEASMSALDDKKKNLEEQIEQLEKQKEQLRAERDQFIAQIILEESDLSKIDDITFLLDLSPITDEQLSYYFNNADIIKLRYYIEKAVILVECGHDIDRFKDRYNRLLEKTRSAAYTQLNDPDDFVSILINKIKNKKFEEIVRMIKQIIFDARQMMNGITVQDDIHHLGK